METFSHQWCNIAAEHARITRMPIFLRRCVKTHAISLGAQPYWYSHRPQLAVLPNGDEVSPIEAIHRFFNRNRR